MRWKASKRTPSVFAADDAFGGRTEAGCAVGGASDVTVELVLALERFFDRQRLVDDLLERPNGFRRVRRDARGHAQRGLDDLVGGDHLVQQSDAQRLAGRD